MSDQVIAHELCRNCRELKVQGLPCHVCGASAPDDAYSCEVCGEYRIRGHRCTSPKHPKEGE